MKRIISVCVVVILFISTCAANAQTPPSVVRGDDYWMRYASKLPIGATVRVRTIAGERMTAVLAIVDDSGITLELKTRVPEPPRHIPYDQLSQLELRQNGSSVGKAIAIGAATGAATFFGIFLVLLAGLD